MGIFSDILIDIEEMWSNGKPSDAIAEQLNKQYGTAYTDVEVDAAVSQIIEAQDQGYNDDMDGDFDSAMASAGFGTEPVEPVAWINVEKRKLEWNTDFPVRWETPTVVKLDKLPLYTTPPSVDALIAELDVLRQQPSEMHSDHEKLLYAIADIADKYRSNK